MRSWRRAELDHLCGLCGETIAIGDAVLLIEIAPTIRLWRCAKCAGPPPPELPPLVERRPLAPQPLTRFGPDMLPLDYKHRAAGRDPGEEG